jgi:mannose-1-phosphate guanylyltransferase
MRALLLAGGKATRLRPLTDRTPKAMTPVLGRPFLEHVLAWLARYDIRDVTLLLGFLPDPIRDYFRDGYQFGVKLTYVVEDQPLGSGGAIKQLERELTEPFFALNADVFTDLDLAAMAADHQASGAEASIFLARVDDPTSYGVCAVDSDGWIERFVEKPRREEAPSDLINAGVWLFEPSILDRIAAGRFTMVEQDLFPALATERRLHGYVGNAAYWIDAGTPERYLMLQEALLNGEAAGALAIVERPGWPGLVLQAVGGEPGGEGTPPRVGAGTRLDGPVVLGAGSIAGESCVLSGPLTIGARGVIGNRAQIEGSVLWEDCRIGDGAVIRSSVLARGCTIGEGSVLERCVLGDGARIHAGAVLTEARIDPGESV